MPTYQYACTECGHQLEAVQSFTDDPLTECPACQGRLRKQFGSVGIVFKGPGFYRTDSRNSANGGGTSGGGTSGNGKAESTDGAGKSDSKPAASSEKSSETKGSDKKSSDKKGSGKTSTPAAA